MVFLRPYQIDAVEAVEFDFAFLEPGSAVLVEMATGTGKTTVFSEVARRWEGRVLVLCHRTELVQQAKARLEADLGERVGIDQAEFRSTFERVVVASVQTVYRKARLERLRRFSPPTLIIADEAHHAPAKSWMTILRAFPGAKVLGVTATPDRGDGRSMGMVFNKVSYRYGLADAIDDGWLVPLRGEEILLENVNLDLVGTSAGDLAAGQLDEEMAQGAEGVVQGILRVAPDKQGIVFCPGVKTAHFIADRLNALKPGCAAAVDGKTETEERAQAIESFRAGKIQWLCNCQVFTEGTDLPMAQVCAIARPTKSRALFTQMVGRIGRCLPGTVDGIDTPEERRKAIKDSDKPYGILLDFVGNNSKHSLATPEDILGGKFSEEEKKTAKKAREDKELGEEATVNDYLEHARNSIRKAAAAIKSSVNMQRRSFDPLNSFGINRENEEKRLSAGKTKATIAQRQALVGMGFSFEEAHSITKVGASRIIDGAKKRREKGLASIKQMRILNRYGIQNDSMLKEVASKAIDYIASTGWGENTDNARVMEIVGNE